MQLSKNQNLPNLIRLGSVQSFCLRIKRKIIFCWKTTVFHVGFHHSTGTQISGEIIKAMISPIFSIISVKSNIGPTRLMISMISIISSIWTVVHHAEILPNLVCGISTVKRSDSKWFPCGWMISIERFLSNWPFRTSSSLMTEQFEAFGSMTRPQSLLLRRSSQNYDGSKR